MIAISDKMLLKLLQSKGMMSITELAKQTGVNRFTLTDVLNGSRKVVRQSTFQKLNDWLLQKIGG